MCAPHQVTRFAVSREEEVHVTCSVDAKPGKSRFRWAFNNTADTIDVPVDHYTTYDTHSIISYTPKTTLDYGALLCVAENEIGTQRIPCLFQIVPAGLYSNTSKHSILGLMNVINNQKYNLGGIKFGFIIIVLLITNHFCYFYIIFYSHT